MNLQEKKVAVFPCNGVGRVVSTITRESAFKIHSLKPDKTVLVSSADLAADNPDAFELVRKYPVIVIDGCKPRCGSNILKAKNINPALEIYVPLVCADKKISIAGETRTRLGLKGMRLVEAITKIGIKAIEDILSGKIPELQKNVSQKIYVDNENILSRL